MIRCLNRSSSSRLVLTRCSGVCQTQKKMAKAGTGSQHQNRSSSTAISDIRDRRVVCVLPCRPSNVPNAAKVTMTQSSAAHARVSSSGKIWLA